MVFKNFGSKINAFMIRKMTAQAPQLKVFYFYRNEWICG